MQTAAEARALSKQHKLHGFIRQRVAATEVAVETVRPRIVCREKAGCAVAVGHSPIRGAGHDVVVWLEGIAAQA